MKKHSTYIQNFNFSKELIKVYDTLAHRSCYYSHYTIIKLILVQNYELQGYYPVEQARNFHALLNIDVALCFIVHLDRRNS